MKTYLETRTEKSFLVEICRYLGSLKLAVFLIAVLGLILMLTTFYESLQSTELVQRFVYTNVWFDFYLTLFALNVFCAVVLRYPFRKHHTGFVVTHLGILIICLGALMNRHFGIDGQMYLREGAVLDSITMGNRVVEIEMNGGGVFQIPTDPLRHRSKIDKSVVLDKSGLSWTLLAFEPKLSRQLRIENSGTAKRNPGVILDVRSEESGFDHRQTLIYFDETNPHAGAWSMGPLTFRLIAALSAEEESVLLTPPTRQTKEDKPYLSFRVDEKNEFIRIPITSKETEPVELPSLDATLYITNYFPNARVVQNRLVNQPDASPNPAVQFEVRAKDGRLEKHTVFALFPDFDALHGGAGQGWSNIRARLEVPSAKLSTQPKASVTVVQGMDEQLRFMIETPEGGHSTEAVKLGQWQSSGRSDIQFRIVEYHPHAVAKYVTTPVGEAGMAPSEDNRDGIQFRFDFFDPSGREYIQGEQQYLMFGENKTLEAGSGKMAVTYRNQIKKVPFALKLVDFRRIFYPGTRSPAAYESDVVLFDQKTGSTIEKRIYMNHPLDSNGYRIFQSSFVEVPPGSAEISIFEVSKMPGTNVIYGGAIVMIAGILVMFYVRPFSSFAQKNIPADT